MARRYKVYNNCAARLYIGVVAFAFKYAIYNPHLFATAFVKKINHIYNERRTWQWCAQ
jgi:hypothetical protein